MANQLISLEYMAGFFDGEGSVSIILTRRPNQRSPRYQLAVCVVQVDPTVLREFKDRFGGNVFAQATHLHRRWTPTFRWHVNCENAARFLEAILDKLVVKRHDAEIGLEFQRLIREANETRGFNRRGGLSSDELAARESVRLKLVARHGIASRAKEA